MARADKDLQLLRLVADIKRTYLEERRQFYIRTRGEDQGSTPNRTAIEQWDGGRDARGVNHSSAWEGIARFAVQYNVDPIELVRAVFETCESSQPPLPSMIKSTKALADLRYVQEFNIEEMKNRYSCYASEAEMKFLLWRKTRKVDEEQLWKEVVSSPELSFSALFRFVLATNLKLAQVADYWRQQAMQEYIRAPNLYDEVLGSTIPVDFREESTRIRKLIHRSC